MSLTPINVKANLLANNDASKIRETQKAHEAGLAENVAQNKDANEKKATSVQKTSATEDKIIRKEDEEEEEKEKPQKKEAQAHKKKEEEEDKKEGEVKKEHPNLPDGLRGFKIDVKI